MRIAQVAPLIESCPPKLYGGTERVASYLTEELVARGHEVTMFASGDSVTAAELIPATPEALRLAGDIDPWPYTAIQLAQVARAASQFDVIHFHLELIHFAQFHIGKWPPVVTTQHGRLDHDYWPEVAACFPTMSMVSISDSQRRPIPGANWAATIHHGLPLNLLHPGKGEGGYLAFLGRVSPLKRADRAVEIARRVGMPLHIAAKIDAIDREYFDREIAHHFEEPFVTYVGEVNDREKEKFLGDAAALLFPIDWPEPFGLVMIEAMATGTPVIAWDEGSAREVIDEGVTGFVVGSCEEAAKAVPAALVLDRDRIRAVFEERFSVQRMADDYLDVYRRLIKEAKGSSASRIARSLAPSAGV